ncbi:energy transducer TonB [Balneolales bacterium ANBcel1]|nr:energy transducer TonB [Balneolales bacterium ANBcel1]
MTLIRNKKPGAELRDYYLINLETGFIVTLLLLIIAFRINLDFSTDLNLKEIEQEVIRMEEVVRTEQINRPPPPPRPPAPRAVPDDVIIDDPFFDLSADLEWDDELGFLPPPPPPPVDLEEEYDEPDVFTIVEEMPMLIGGMSALYQHLRYPELARMAGIEGRVIVQFVIDENGNVQDPVVVRGVGGGLDEAALEAVKKIRFTPGKQRGRPVKVRYSLPITFRLSG